MAVFSQEIGLNANAAEHPLGMYPTNIRMRRQAD